MAVFASRQIVLPKMVNYVNFIESSGTQYINTEFNPNQNTRIIMDYQSGDACVVGSVYTLFGVRVASSGMYWSLIKDSTSAWLLRHEYNTVYSTKWDMTETTFKQRRTVEINGASATIDGTTKSYTAATFQFNYPIYLFASNEAGTANYYTPMKIYSCQIYDNGTLVRDYLPCLDKDGVACLYDKVEKKCYYNAGTGEFTAG